MVKLLLDENLAPSLTRRLADLYPGSAHVRDFGLSAANDAAIWAYAIAQGFAIVTRDDDFRQRSFLIGAAPKVIWVRLGNCRTSDIEAVLRTRWDDVLAFESDPESALLVLARRTDDPPRQLGITVLTRQLKQSSSRESSGSSCPA